MTVDPELARALVAVDAAPQSRSRLVRDLALRGAHAVQQDRIATQGAIELLLRIADGDERYEFGSAADLHAERGDRLP